MVPLWSFGIYTPSQGGSSWRHRLHPSIIVVITIFHVPSFLSRCRSGRPASLPGILQYGFWKPNLVFKTHIRFLTKYGFYSKPVCVFWKLNLIFKTQMWFLITHFKFGIFFANSVNFEIIVKTRFGFQDTNLDLKNRIWFYMKTKCGFLIWKTVFESRPGDAGLEKLSTSWVKNGEKLIMSSTPAPPNPEYGIGGVPTPIYEVRI